MESWKAGCMDADELLKRYCAGERNFPQVSLHLVNLSEMFSWNQF
jgi:hypothetical protein